MNTDTLRSSWNNTSDSFSEYGNQPTPLPRNCRTTVDNLASRYLRFAILAAAMVLVMPLFARNEFVPEPFRLPIMLVGIAFFLTCCIMDLWLYGRVKGMDIFNAPVRVVMETAMRCRRFHLRCMCVTLPFAMCYIALVAYAIANDTAVIWGMVIGGLTGLLLGLRELRRFMKDYRSLIHPEE